MATSSKKKEANMWLVEDIYDYMHLHLDSSCAMATRRRHISLVKAFWGWAEAQGYIDKSPARQVLTPPLILRSKLLFPQIPAPIMTSLRAHMDQFSYAAVVSMWACALRPDDLDGFHERLIDDRRMLVRVRRKGTGPYIEHHAPICDDAVLRELYIAVRGQFSKLRDPKDRWKRQLDFAIKKTQSPQFSFADLRNYRIDCWIREGHHPLMIQKWTGIRGMGTLLRHYEASFEQESETWPRPSALDKKTGDGQG